MDKPLPVREAVAVFTAIEDMEAAIDELLTSGFDRAEISLLALEEAIKEKLGHAFSSTRELEDNPDAPYVAYIARESLGSLEGYVIGGLLYVGAIVGFAPVLASGGAIGAAILAGTLGGGGGAAIGSILAGLIDKRHADFLENQLKKGGILLWVRTRDLEHEQRARDILSRHSAEDVHIHGIPDEGLELEKHYLAESRLATGADFRALSYRGIQISVAGDGHCFAINRMFTSKSEAQRFIDLVNAEV